MRIHIIAPDKGYQVNIFAYFSMKMYDVGEALLMSIHNKKKIM